ERCQQAAVVISVHVWSKQIAHHLVPTQRDPSARIKLREPPPPVGVRVHRPGRVGVENSKWIVPGDDVSLDVVADSIEVRTDSDRGSAVESLNHLHGRATVGEARAAIDPHTEIISSHDCVCPRAAIPFQYPMVVGVSDTTKNVPFLRVIEAIAIRSDDDVVAVRADFDKGFHSVSRVAHAAINIKVMKAVGENVKEIPADSCAIAFYDNGDLRSNHHVELSPCGGSV